MKKIFKVGLIAAISMSLVACDEPKDTGIDGSVEPNGEVIGGYHFNGKEDNGIEAKVIKDENGCVFMLSEYDTPGGYGYSHDIEFMGGCDFPSLYEK